MEEAIGDQNRGRSLDIIKQIKHYMEEQYSRNMLNKMESRSVQRPEYLNNFKYKPDPNVKEKLLAVKRGIYSLEKEDIQLVDIIKDLQTNPKKA